MSNATYFMGNTNNQDSTQLDILCYADAGCTKTAQIATLKQAGFNPFVITSEYKATLPLRNHGIDYVDCPTFASARAFVDDCLRTGYFNNNNHDFICLDGASTLSYLSLKECPICPKDKRLKFNEAYIMFKSLIDDIRRFRKHLYVNAHGAKNDATGKIQPKVEGAKACIDFAGMFTSVFNIRTLADANGVPTLIFQTFDDGIYNCKDRNLTVDFKPKLDRFEIATLESGGLGRVALKMLTF